MRRLFFPIYLTICICSLLACTDYTSAELDKAEALLEDAQYEEAYALLDTLDGCKYQPGSRLQARYALLYTRALYKNYIVSPSDSLISLAVDYAEKHGDDEDKFYAYLYQGIVRHELYDYANSTFSLIRAMANADGIEDAYSKGQMYTYLSLDNCAQQCSDAVYYARMAYNTYVDGGLESYKADALSTLANAKLVNLEYDSALVYVNKSIRQAEITDDLIALNEAISLKANYYYLADSIENAYILYNRLYDAPDYVFKMQDMSNLAYIYAKKNMVDSCMYYLSLARKGCIEKNDSIKFYVASIWVDECFGDITHASLGKDTLLNFTERLLAEGASHTALAYQRDYAEWRMALAEENHFKRMMVMTLLIAITSLLTVIFYLNSKKKLALNKLQSERIKNLQLQIEQHSVEIQEGLSYIKNSKLVTYFHELSVQKGTTQIKRWSELNALFAERMPYFEKTLRELTPMSDIEWHLCMLLKLGFTPSEMSVLLSRSPSSISAMRSRLYEKVYKKKGTPSDWDLFIQQM